MISGVGKTILRTLTATVVAFLFIAAAPLAVSAQSAIRSFSMDRTTISQGGSISFTVRTTAEATHVFATVDGVHTQGTRVNANQNDWTVTVSPSRSTTVTIFANNQNNQTGAASISIPVTVTGTTSQTPSTPAQTTVAIPPAPANLGPIDIASVTETPATAQGEVQLTVVTGAETNDVWVNFDRVNNARATGRFARGTMISQNANSRTWVINFRPNAWATQQVEIGSNRTYNWPGASTQFHNLTLSQPFVPPSNPAIQNVTVSNRSVNTGSNTTFTIRTNNDVEHVWVRDADGREHNANRTTTSGANRNWTVTFNPVRSGNVTIFANATRTETGAVTRTENINVGHNFDATIVGTPTATWVSGNNTRINVTTNQHAETVWAVMPGSNNRIQLNRTNSGSGNRTWSIDTWDSSSSGNIIINVSSQTGNINHLSADDTRTISRSGTSSSGSIISVAHWHNSNRDAARGGYTEFRIRTSVDVDRLEVFGTQGEATRITRGHLSNNEREWSVEVRIFSNVPINSQVAFTVEAYVNNNLVDTRTLPLTTITN